MTEYPEYFVIERLTRVELQADVTARLADGFKLAGGLHVIDRGDHNVFYQAVYRVFD